MEIYSRLRRNVLPVLVAPVNKQLGKCCAVWSIKLYPFRCAKATPKSLVGVVANQNVA